MTRQTAGYWITLGGVLIVVGVFLPWASVTQLGITDSARGSQFGAGVVAAFEGAAVALFGILLIREVGSIALKNLALIVAFAALEVALANLIDLALVEVEDTDIAAGLGLYLVAAGGLTAVVAALASLFSRDVPAPEQLSLRSLFASREGRLNRGRYWTGSVLVGIAVDGVSTMSNVFQPTVDAMIWIALVLAVGALYPSYAISAKRFQDRDRPGRLALVILVPAALVAGLLFVTRTETLVEPSFVPTAGIIVLLVLGLWFFIELGCLPGTSGPNRYGPDPMAFTGAGGGPVASLDSELEAFAAEAGDDLTRDARLPTILALLVPGAPDPLVGQTVARVTAWRGCAVVRYTDGRVALRSDVFVRFLDRTLAGGILADE